MIRPTVEVLLSMVDNLSAPLRSTAQGVQGIASGIGNAVKGMAAAAVAYVTADFFADSIKEALAAEEATSKLSQAVTNAGDSFTEWGPKVDESVSRLTKLTRFGDDDFKSAMTNMVSKSGDVKGSLSNIGLAADIAAMKGISLADAGDLVGKVMAGNTKPLKEFGITASSSADGMAQLREKTAGYAEKDLTTLGGKLAQTKQNFSEVKEEVGKVLIGTAGLGDGISTLSQFLASMAEWVAKNSHHFDELVGGLKVTLSAVLGILEPIWELVKGAWALVDGFIPFGLILKGVQVPLIAVATAFKYVLNVVNFTVGGVLQTVGLLLSKAAPLLDRFGLGLGKVGDDLLAKGTKMVADANKNWSEYGEKMIDQMVKVAVGGDGAQKKLTKSYGDGAAARGEIVDRETTGEAKMRADSGKKLEELQKLAFKGQMVLLGAQQREYEELVATFQEKMQGMTKADQAKAETLLKEAHTRVLLKWAGLAKELEPTVIRPIERIQHRTELLTAEIAHTADAMPMQKFYQLQKVASEIGPEIQQAAGDMLQFTDALGIASPRLDSIIGGISSLGQGLASFGSGNILGGFTAGLAGFSSVLGGIFGDSPADKARKELLAKNNQRLLELKEEIGTLLNLNTTGAKIAAFQGVDVGALVQGTMNRDVGSKDFGKLSIGQVGKFLAGRGLGLRDFQDLADQLGIDLGSDGKNFNTEAVVGLLDFVKNNSFTGVDQSSFKGQLDALELKNSAVGGTEGDFLFGLSRIASGPGGSSAIANIFRDQVSLTPVNFADGLSLDEIWSMREQTIGLVNAFADGKISSAGQGDLSNAQFRALLEQLVSVMGTVAEGVVATAEFTRATAAASEATAGAVQGDTYAQKLDVILADLATSSATNMGR